MQNKNTDKKSLDALKEYTVDALEAFSGSVRQMNSGLEAWNQRMKTYLDENQERIKENEKKVEKLKRKMLGKD